MNNIFFILGLNIFTILEKYIIYNDRRISFRNMLDKLEQYWIFRRFEMDSNQMNSSLWICHYIS